MSLQGCHSLAAQVTGGIVGTTFLGARSVGSEIQQTYYLGVLDPESQVPTQVYRLRVHGQGSALGFTRFGSGWVPAAIADSLGTNISFDKDSSGPSIQSASKDSTAVLKPGRRLVLFGPEGFREAPADQRLVIVMGSDPSAYFQGIETALGNVAEGKAKQSAQQSSGQLNQSLFSTLTQLDQEREELEEFSKAIDRDIPANQTVIP
jgi:hypothetical protein